MKAMARAVIDLKLGVMGGRLGAVVSLIPSASTLCQLLALGLLVETRLELAAQERPQHDTARRSLDGASFPTVAPVEAMLVEHAEAVEAAVDRAEAAVTEMRGELAAVNHKGPREQTTVRDLANAMEHLGDRLQRLELTVDSLRSRGGTERRARRRRVQAQTGPQSCNPTAFQTRTDEVMAACCPATAGGGGGTGGGHRRFLQADCALPGTCPSASCAATFVAYFDNCGTMLAQTGFAELAQLRGFYTRCQELDASMQLMLDSAEPAMIFHVLVLSESDAQAGIARREHAADARLRRTRDDLPRAGAQRKRWAGRRHVSG